MRNPLVPKPDYHDYFNNKAEGRAVTLEHFFDPKKTNMLSRFRELTRDIAGPITLLVLGSATPRNLTHLSRFLKKAGCKDATVLIVDSAKKADEIHRAEIKKLNGGNSTGSVFHFILEDMRTVNLPNEIVQVNVIMSDFTLNFLQSPKDIRAMYTQIKDTLVPGGRAFIHVNACDDSDKTQDDTPKIIFPGMTRPRFLPHPRRNDSYTEDQGHDRLMTVFPLSEHIKLAKRAGLSLVGSPRRTNKDGNDWQADRAGSYPYLLELVSR